MKPYRARSVSEISAHCLLPQVIMDGCLKSVKRNTSFTLNRILSKLFWKIKSSGEETPCLPEQLIMDEILPRLPVKSLLKFKCVSKPWCSLIGSKRFIKAHLKYSIKTSNKCIFLDYYKDEFKQCSLASMFDKVFAHSISPFADLGIYTTRENVFYVGFCNGLVCLRIHEKRFILWNPTTKKFKNLPYFNNERSRGFILKYGFGFDELNDDYKVFVTRYKFDVTDNFAFSKVYSLRSNSWKYIEEERDAYEARGVGVFVGGKLHWNTCKGEIVSLDLNSNVCGVVELPSYVKGDIYSIGVLGGCLSAHLVHSNGDLDVWVMKEYGVKESWDKVVTIPYYENPNYRETPTPLAVAPNGEVLLVSNSTFVIYNPKSDMFRKSHIPELDGTIGGVDCIGIYMEGLASVES